mmetsp:Transcript_7408/g.9689  ORF Transcript_7408/g.9689 Transcript_7408/m.9689 type:complete len:637 (-) Transcript_7408:672-2582(-)|eukprot:CAMPEP_0184012426 /NCGR_PEP_ID=MMETSP0954-20121128/4406_1 /TAXON_ID=627963 /ORGANISM="Aplanochytrium sp, Strain PBS07" /LENGTH=636 /DNA_ID=CAMNT_0026292413 /DNA_START=28 /DNA_END=1938 /DNA_ORIENTATION=+
MANAESQSEADSLPQYDVFLSHAGYDGGQKLETSILHDKLKDYVKVFFDRDSLKPGKRKAVHRMVHAVATAKVIVVILSPEYLCREWCLRELEVALARAEENKVFKKGKSFSEFLKERFHEDELSEVKEVQNIDEIPAIIIPVFHSLSPHQCRNLRDVLDGFPTVKEKFTDWYFNDSPITKKRWELALKEISKHVGLEFFQRAVPWKENADRIRDTVFQNLGVAVPVRRENPAETPKKKLVPSIPPLERHWSNTLYGSELEKIVDYLCGTKSLLLSGIVGCGGVGKTVLGIQVVHNDKIKTHFKTIFYLRAGHDADSQNLLLQWYQQIRKTDYLGETNLSEEKLKQSILSHGLENVLVIVDNVWKQKCIGAIRKILRHSKTSRMLITTQLRNLLPLGTSKKFTVEPVSADAGLHFLKERAGEDWNQEWSDNDARKLVKKTGGVVLFMSLVAGLLDHRKIDALDLIIEELDEKGSDIHKFHRGAFAKEIKTYGATGLACLQLSIDSLKDERQRNRYIMLGVFPLAISSIPVESLKEIWKIDTINDTKRTADVYESRSLLQRNGDFISLHELQRKYLGEVYQEYSREQKNGFPIDESTIGYAFFDGAYKLDEVMYRQVLSLREKRGNGDLSITVASFQ